MSSFCSAKATHIFSATNIRIMYIESPKTVNEMTLNELVKLTTLWTTGPWTPKELNILHLKFEQMILLPADVSKTCWMSDVDTDQMLHLAESNLGLHYLPDCLSEHLEKLVCIITVTVWPLILSIHYGVIWILYMNSCIQKYSGNVLAEIMKLWRNTDICKTFLLCPFVHQW